MTEGWKVGRLEGFSNPTLPPEGGHPKSINYLSISPGQSSNNPILGRRPRDPQKPFPTSNPSNMPSEKTAAMLIINTRTAPPRKVGGGLDDPAPKPKPVPRPRHPTAPRLVTPPPTAPRLVTPPPEPAPAPEPELPPAAEVVELDQRRPTPTRDALVAAIDNLDDGMLATVHDILAAVLTAGAAPPNRRRSTRAAWACPMPTIEEADWTANRPRVLAPFHCRHCGRPFHVRRHLEAHEAAAERVVAA